MPTIEVEETELPEPNRLPLITVGMPTYNREWSLPEVLEAVLNFSYARSRIRICFIDNESTDGTIRIINAFRAEHEKEYESIVVRTMKSNIPEARNQIFKEAKGTDYVFFVDADIIAPPDAIPRLLGSFAKDHSVGIASLPWDNRNARRRAGFLYNAFTAPDGPHPAYKVGNGCNIVSMKVYEKVGGFNEKLAVHEDGEFCFRLRKAGFEIICDFSSEGTHLREYKLGWMYYLNFMNDSSRTYKELILRGSMMHLAKVVLSVVALAFLLALLALPSYLTLGAFVVAALSAVLINGSARILDDGIYIRGLYRLPVGFVFTVATLIISGFLVYRVAFRKP
jgi:glycosyltransferase involved in cell wall biosynthesis